MALIRCDFYSMTLSLSTSMTVLLPQPESGIGIAGATSGLPSVLYLLHGLTDDDTIWTRRTSIERYVAPLGLAVVMPQVHHSFYSNEAHGHRFWAFLSEELPDLVQTFFRVSDRREDTFVAGLSMGGYGAMKWALRQPERFAAAASLSGALDLAQDRASDDPWVTGILERVFGQLGVAGTPDDTVHLARQAVPSDMPPLYIACGTEDDLYPQSLAFAAAARERGLDVTTDFGPGEHDWAYWDDAIQRVLGWLPRT